MTKKLKWRLSKLPTPQEVIALIESKIITQEEAKEILFSSETEEERDEKSLKEEIKFLRQLVEKLSSNRNQIVETIRYYQEPYNNRHWFGPYINWCSSDSGITMCATSSLNDQTLASTSSTTLPGDFTNISTF